MRSEIGGGNGATLLQYKLAEVLHVDLAEVAGGYQGLEGDLFVLTDVLGPEHDGLVLLDVFLGFDPYLEAADLVVPIDQLHRYVPGVYHELDSHPQGLLPDAGQNLRLYLQGKDQHQLVGLAHCYFTFL